MRQTATQPEQGPPLQIASSVLLAKGHETIAQLCYPNNDASTVLFARSADFEHHGGFG